LIFFSSPLFGLARSESDDHGFARLRVADEKSGSANNE
jgi:hypothetical protein